MNKYLLLQLITLGGLSQGALCSSSVVAKQQPQEQFVTLDSQVSETLFEYSETLREMAEAAGTIDHVQVPSQLIQGAHALSKLLKQLEADPTSDITLVVKWLPEKLDDLLALAEAHDYLGLEKRVLLSACLYKIVQTYEQEQVGQSKPSDTILVLLNAHYHLKAGLPPQYAGIGFSIAELLAHKKVPEASYGILDLSERAIESLEGWERIPKFEDVRLIHLDNNKLRSLPDQLLDNCRNLVELHLTNNQLRSLPDQLLDNCGKLVWFDLENNQLTTLPDQLLDHCGNLKGLKLSNNQLRSLPHQLLAHCGNLKGLDLSNNQLRSLPEGLFNNCGNLEELCLNDNQLTTLPEGLLDNCGNLEILSLSNNQLTSLPEELAARGFELGEQNIEKDSHE